ncbi:hypothetical protein IFM89_023167 [Coptis chinensis]|uniref:Reverse transcriptase domain-containing protein n=1 Tax=Coptis chinensis TaxID=261450 RepID=A0A835M6K6_9MAGN|nr:hypothetical protein IFM89_023167 [Coptis chinensis]
MLLLRTRQLEAQIVEYNDEVELLKQQEDIKSFIFSAYETKYQHHEVHSNSELMSLIPQLVRDEENIVLTAVPTHQEVEDAVFSMEANSSPGPDGFQGIFYLAFWSIIGQDVSNAIVSVFKDNKLPKGMNLGFRVLIPEVTNAIRVNQYRPRDISLISHRPISLSNFLFKIITKILSMRIKHVADRLISNEQLAFIQGRTGLTGWLSFHKSFSDWPGIKWALSELKPHLEWVVGQGKAIDLWKESWASKAVYDCLP